MATRDEQAKEFGRPYLTREATNEKLEKLGFIFKMNWTLQPGQEERFQALQELLAGAIAEYLDLRDDIRDEDPPGAVEAELQEWTEEYLVG
jgi:hypothetical protein